MFKVSITSNAVLKQETFILSYRNIFLRLYSDTGIQDEKHIIDNYMKLSTHLSKQIEDIIFWVLEQNIVLWRKEDEMDIFLIIRRCEWFYIHIKYHENIVLQERTILDLIFYKK